MNNTADINLNCCKHCQLGALLPSNAKHRGGHYPVSFTSLCQFIQSICCTMQYSHLQAFATQMTTSLKQIQTKLKKLMDKMQEQINKIKLNIILDLKNQYKLEQAMSFFYGNTNNLNKFTCADVFYIYEKVSQFDLSKHQNVDDKIYECGNKIQAQVSQYLQDLKKITMKFNNQNKNIKMPQPTNSKQYQNNVTKQTIKVEKQQQRQESDHQQYRPSRRPYSPQKVQKYQKSNNGKLKIKQLQFLEQSQSFTIRLKVLRIIKNFTLRNTRKIQFQVGDQTGIAFCVADQNSNIRIGKTIDITNCRIYMFKKKVRQIQQRKNSIITPAEEIKTIGRQFNLSDSDKRSYRRDNQRSDNAYQRRRSENQYIRGDRKEQKRQDRREQKRQDRREQKRQDSRQEKRRGDRREQTRQPKKEEKGQKQQFFSQNNNPQSPFTVIQDIQPGGQSLKIMAQIYKIIQTSGNKLICQLGDQTGIIKAELPQSLNFLKQGISVRITNAQSPVVNQHIILKLTRLSKIEPVHASFPLIKITNNISAGEWVEDQDNENQEQNQQEAD